MRCPPQPSVSCVRRSPPRGLGGVLRLAALVAASLLPVATAAGGKDAGLSAIIAHHEQQLRGREQHLRAVREALARTEAELRREEVGAPGSPADRASRAARVEALRVRRVRRTVLVRRSELRTEELAEYLAALRRGKVRGEPADRERALRRRAGRLRTLLAEVRAFLAEARTPGERAAIRHELERLQRPERPTAAERGKPK